MITLGDFSDLTGVVVVASCGSTFCFLTDEVGRTLRGEVATVGVTVSLYGSELRSARVFGPTSPGKGARSYACWKRISASFVIGPK